MSGRRAWPTTCRSWRCGWTGWQAAQTDEPLIGRNAPCQRHERSRHADLSAAEECVSGKGREGARWWASRRLDMAQRSVARRVTGALADATGRSDDEVRLA